MLHVASACSEWAHNRLTFTGAPADQGRCSCSRQPCRMHSSRCLHSLGTGRSGRAQLATLTPLTPQTVAPQLETYLHLGRWVSGTEVGSRVVVVVTEVQYGMIGKAASFSVTSVCCQLGASLNLSEHYRTCTQYALGYSSYCCSMAAVLCVASALGV